MSHNSTTCLFREFLSLLNVIDASTCLGLDIIEFHWLKHDASKLWLYQSSAVSAKGSILRLSRSQ